MIHHEIGSSHYRFQGQRHQHYVALFMRTRIILDLNHTRIKSMLVSGGKLIIYKMSAISRHWQINWEYDELTDEGAWPEAHRAWFCSIRTGFG